MANRLTFYLDEHISQAVATGLRRYDVDVLTVHDANLISASDIKQLAFARRTGRVMVTRDEDFTKLHAEGARHSGIIFFSREYSIGEMVRQLHLASEVLTPREMRNHIEYL
jgi:predicted nuclease of predicted toxin-antitoxin system